jgi:D-alanyl-lipoteichoic acid acyltransferase DltB (MBOAT superfamily)
MTFNSFAFVVFLPLVFAVHWGLSSRVRLQNVVIIAASFIFYGWWDVRFLSLLLLSSVLDFTVGLLLDKEERQPRRNFLISISLVSQLGLLATFKYFNFFIDSFSELLQALGFQVNAPTLRIILPVGISFYTFQTLSYTIDVYRRQISALRDPFAFFAFVSFFPQLVAGPIERASRMLPQFSVARVFGAAAAVEGLRQALWGMAKKVVVADNLAPHVTAIFRNYESLDGVTLAWGGVLFSVQLYCDFSGYSDIAVGIAKLFGINLSRNFRYPFFATNIADFWRRWHISLSTWFRDYLYIPLGGSHASRITAARNVMATFCVSGLWHGADWKFVIWGFLHGAYYVVWSLVRPSRVEPAVQSRPRFTPAVTELIGMATTFALVTLAFVFFRAESVGHAYGYLLRGVTHPLEPIEARYGVALAYVFPLAAVEWTQRHREHGLDVRHMSVAVRWMLYLATALVIMEFGNFGEVEFIYFQF